jgi:hypothetical protein
VNLFSLTKISLHSLTRKQVGKRVFLAEELFGAQPNELLMQFDLRRLSGNEVSTVCGSGWVPTLPIFDCRLPIGPLAKHQLEIGNRQSAVDAPIRYRGRY